MLLAFSYAAGAWIPALIVVGILIILVTARQEER